MGFKNAHTRAGFFEKLRQQGKYKDDSASGAPKIGVPKISTPKAPSVSAPKAPKVANTSSGLMNLSKPMSAPKLMDAMPESILPNSEPVVGKIRFKKLKRLF